MAMSDTMLSEWEGWGITLLRVVVGVVFLMRQVVDPPGSDR